MFEKLKYGNVIEGPGGDKFVVLHVVRDANEKVETVGILPALNAVDFAEKGFKVTSTRSSQTFLAGRSIPGELES